MSPGKKLILLFGLAGGLFLVGCSGDREISYQALHIDGLHWAFNLSSSYITFGAMTGSEEPGSLSLPVSDGDLLFLIRDDDFELYYRYRREDGNHLELSFDTVDAYSVSINNRLAFLRITGDSACLEELRSIPGPELRQVSALYFPEGVDRHIIDALKLRENSLKGPGLVLENAADGEMFDELLSICRPVWLGCNAPPDKPSTSHGNNYSNLELLWLTDQPQDINQILLCCTGLRALIISGWEADPGELISLSDLNTLTSLTLADCRLKEPDQVELPAGLERLHLIGCDTIDNLEAAGRLPKLTSLSLNGTVLRSPFDLKDHTENLKYISFPANTDDLSFRSMSAKLPNVEVVEMIQCNSVSDLSPLQLLDKLEVLLLSAESFDPGQLIALSDLDMLILDQTIFDDSPGQISELKASLPETEIVPGSGLCLGSGWLMLLLPLIMLFRFLRTGVLTFKARK